MTRTSQHSKLSSASLARFLVYPSEKTDRCILCRCQLLRNRRFAKTSYGQILSFDTVATGTVVDELASRRAPSRRRLSGKAQAQRRLLRAACAKTRSNPIFPTPFQIQARHELPRQARDRRSQETQSNGVLAQEFSAPKLRTFDARILDLGQPTRGEDHAARYGDRCARLYSLELHVRPSFQLYTRSSSRQRRFYQDKLRTAAKKQAGFCVWQSDAV